MEVTNENKLAARMEKKRIEQVLKALGWRPPVRFSPGVERPPNWNDCLTMIQGKAAQAARWVEHKEKVRRQGPRYLEETGHVLLSKCYAELASIEALTLSLSGPDGLNQLLDQVRAHLLEVQKYGSTPLHATGREAEEGLHQLPVGRKSAPRRLRASR